MAATKGNAWLKNLRPAAGITGVLTTMFRILCRDMNVNPYRWNSLMESYLHREVAVAEKKRREKESRLNDPNRPELDHMELNRRDRTSIRGNLNKEFGRESMTWKVFCKAMAFLQITSFRLVLVVDHRSGVRTQHESPLIILDQDTVEELIQDSQTEKNTSATSSRIHAHPTLAYPELSEGKPPSYSIQGNLPNASDIAGVPAPATNWITPPPAWQPSTGEPVYVDRGATPGLEEALKAAAFAKTDADDSEATPPVI